MKSVSKHRGSTPRRVLVVTAAASAGLLLGVGSAVAYWSTTGTGTGAARSSTMVAPTVSAGTTTGPLLYPGLTADGTSTGGTLAISASNPNPFPVTVTVAGGTATGCTTPDVTLRAGQSFTLPASSGTVTRNLTFAVSMGTASSNDCQGKTITVPLTTTSVSTAN